MDDPESVSPNSEEQKPVDPDFNPAPAEDWIDHYLQNIIDAADTQLKRASVPPNAEEQKPAEADFRPIPAEGWLYHYLQNLANAADTKPKREAIARGVVDALRTTHDAAILINLVGEGFLSQMSRSAGQVGQPKIDYLAIEKNLVAVVAQA